MQGPHFATNQDPHGLSLETANTFSDTDLSLQQGLENQRIVHTMVSVANRWISQLKAAAGTEHAKDVSGNPNSPATAFDLAIEKDIELRLAQLDPTIGFLGEECSKKPEFQKNVILTKHKLAVCDPIDGTKNFRSGSGWYSPALGILNQIPDQSFEPSLGIIIDPQNNYLWHSDGASLNVIDLSTGSQFDIGVLPGKRERLIISGNQPNRTKWFKPGVQAGIDFDKAPENRALIKDLLDVAIGASDGALITANFWDFAPAVPFLQSQGVQLWCAKEMKRITSFSKEFFIFSEPDTWRPRYPIFAVRERDFQRFSKLFSESPPETKPY